ncbi:hypothetical protein P8452_23836 [Trifolium repens]|nr:hypothetical protein P8452_23836 [Trifolium repens]
METVPDQATTICTHCDRAVPAANIDLHSVHCARNLEKCKVCGDMVPKQHADDHYLNVHAPVTCSLCSETMVRDILDIHKGENCPQRIVTCEFCEFPLPAIDLAEHQEVCGNRTEMCHLCNKYVRLREINNHEVNCNRIQANGAGSSRDERPAERNGSAPRRHQNEFPKGRLLITVAITGIAVILGVGSILYPRKAGTSNVH